MSTRDAIRAITRIENERLRGENERLRRLLEEHERVADLELHTSAETAEFTSTSKPPSWPQARLRALRAYEHSSRPAQSSVVLTAMGRTWPHPVQWEGSRSAQQQRE